ncbi:PDDEXK nuclease domain-containing protein [Leptothoe sp. PORK10 BA2]|uniref:PDDEXK nuclease domain-containing protein n=1 Tax=Leptothoe sp. PORK10 BA2 TaxID=3110254 RepID=UPI002B1EB45E|nr:PDDEXK nuclease domain-containing protein [Leptothoe sp. PORK10 BA2]MEA5466974.1 PDDEXK nuclease domain-containing protein [Leptothoe sp. PORK10 BA2]
MDDSIISQELFKEVRQLIDTAKQKVAITINSELTLLYWHIGKRIQIEILNGQRGEYGKQVLQNLSIQLQQAYGRGWGQRHLRNCLYFAEQFPDIAVVTTVCSQLSWSHFRVLSGIDDSLKREFYIEIAQLEKWSVRQLKERVDSMLYERTALSRKPEEAISHDIAQLRDEQAVSPALLLKDPYVLDFLELNDRYTERDLEDAILREIERFLLEMGAGFTFVSRQKRLQIDDDDFYIDLLFYNRKLKRLVAIDLKIGNFRPEYKSQMELYLRWLQKHDQEPEEQPPLGIILCAGKKQEQIELLELDRSGIHVAEYLTVLPSKEILQAKLQNAIAAARSRIASNTEEQETSQLE